MAMTDRDIPAAAPREADLEAGARNLLVSCVGVESGQSVLFVREDSAHGYYDEAAGNRVEEEARRLGARVHSIRTSPIAGPEGFPKPIAAAMGHVDHTIFFSRIGDQLRFCDLPGPGTKTMAYALDAGYLGSEFCTVPHALMEEVQARLHAELDRAHEWRITCPLGTDISGGFEPPQSDGALPGGFTLFLFPVTTFRPISCRTTTGKVALARWLMATGTHTYEPGTLPLDQPVTVRVEDGRIAGFEGDPEAVSRVRAHYAAVAAQFGIDPDVVHSWHAGINPKTYYTGPARENLERWGGISFGSPRYLHFHTCGDYAPGEIAWSIFDATITVDGVPFWQDGRFVFLERDDLQALLRKYPGAESAYEMRRDIGF